MAKKQINKEIKQKVNNFGMVGQFRANNTFKPAIFSPKGGFNPARFKTQHKG